MTYRVCRGCSLEANTEEELKKFTIGYRHKHNRKNQCKLCFNIERKKTPSGEYFKTREYNFKYNYGISLSDYTSLFQEQQGCCLICDTLEEKLVVDHNHETGEVRGLLCSQCNSALGFMGDNPKTLLKAYEYLTDKGNYALFKGEKL